MDNLNRVLTETMAWCSVHKNLNDPKNCLRTPALEPSPLEDVVAYPNWSRVWRMPIPPIMKKLIWRIYQRDASRQRKIIIENLAEQRAQLLRAQNMYLLSGSQNFKNGKLLLSAGAEESVIDGASEAESQGFFDMSDLPPWDTWIAYISGDRRCGKYRWRESYVLSWVPEEMIDFVGDAIEVNCVDCIHWADQCDTNFTRELRSAGLIE